ncbi:hypothetical protein KEJ21_05480 [Candidatus Bathyarchaeota archaeon]|nr:hypothetical protein [Candidatus Bathyarchaeota archaeon]MBS7631143.1 hypothetical protein [Candidatus Bathyarchaeota archaeon]
MTSKSTPNPIMGYSDRSTVKLDFDDVPLKKVKKWVIRAYVWFDLDGFIVIFSSEDHYHAVFNRSVTWSENIQIMNWVAIESQLPTLKEYALMQGIKGPSTLRWGLRVRKSCRESWED